MNSGIELDRNVGISCTTLTVCLGFIYIRTKATKNKEKNRLCSNIIEPLHLASVSTFGSPYASSFEPVRLNLSPVFAFLLKFMLTLTMTLRETLNVNKA